EALAARAQTWSLDDFKTWMCWARGDDDGRPQTGGIIDQLAELAIARRASFPLAERQVLMLDLWNCHESLAHDLRNVIGDAVLETDPAGNDQLRETRVALEQLRSVAAADAAPLPTTRAALEELYDLAQTDRLAERTLQRGLAQFNGSELMRAEYGA